MSDYLSKIQIAEIANEVSVYPLGSKNIRPLESYFFDVGEAEEYKTFLFEKAWLLDAVAISKTFVMLHKITDELIGYFTLSADTIKLTPQEKSDGEF